MADDSPKKTKAAPKAKGGTEKPKKEKKAKDPNAPKVRKIERDRQTRNKWMRFAQDQGLPPPSDPHIRSRHAFTRLLALPSALRDPHSPLPPHC